MPNGGMNAAGGGNLQVQSQNRQVEQRMNQPVEVERRELNELEQLSREIDEN